MTKGVPDIWGKAMDDRERSKCTKKGTWETKTMQGVIKKLQRISHFREMIVHHAISTKYCKKELLRIKNSST